MISTYTLGTYGSEDTHVVVTYEITDAETSGISSHMRNVYIPRLENGDVNEPEFCDILEGQLLGVQKKAALGVIHFQ